MALAAGTRLGPYEILAPLGAGGMGEVYRARDTKLGRDVALKVLPADSLGDETARRHFRTEAEALVRLSHPHIATVYDFDKADGTDFLVMELVRGHSVQDELQAKGALPEKTVVRLGTQLARGLQAAHEQGVIHRDLKPSNLQITPDGLLKILDFGLARLLPKERVEADETAPTQTAVGGLAGTLPYMSPEQLRGRGVDERTDLYAAGAVLYEMVTGRRLFSKPSSAELTDAILHEEPTPPREVNPQISSGLEAVILKALDKDAELRHQSARDLIVDLERLQLRSDPRSSGSEPARRAAGASMVGDTAGERESWHRAPFRRSLALLATAGASLGMLGGILWWAWPEQPPRITATRALANSASLYSFPAQSVATDGERLYYVTAKGEANVLVQVSLDGGETVETPLPFRGFVFLLCALPDGSDVLVAGARNEGGGTGSAWGAGLPVWRVPLALGAPQRLGKLEAREADVSPDGQSLALIHGNSVLIASTDGSSAREIHRFEERPSHIRWAPDGRRLRLTLWAPGEDESFWFWEMPVDGGAPRRLWPGLEGDWTGDGRYFVFRRLLDGEIFVARDAWWTRWLPAEPQQVTSGPVRYSLFGSCADGTCLVGSFSSRNPVQRGTLMRFDPERRLFEVALGGESAFYAEPSPDGEWLAWVLYPEGTLWRSRPDGTERLQLTSPPAVAHLPRWSPDGTLLVYASQPEPTQYHKEIRIVSVDRSEGVLIARPDLPNEAYWDPCWLPDDSIVFSHGSPLRPGLLRYDPGKQQVESVPGAGDLVFPKCSPRGDLIAIAVRADGIRLWRLRRSGKTDWHDVGTFGHAYAEWTKDGRSVCALSLPGRRIECMNVDEGRMTLLTDTSTLALASWVAVPWMGLDALDRPMVVATSEQPTTIYRFEWEAP